MNGCLPRGQVVFLKGGLSFPLKSVTQYVSNSDILTSFCHLSDIFVTRLSYLTMESSPGKHQSLNWQYFERLPSGKAKCKTCCKEISCTGGNTSGLLRHLEAYHPKLVKVGIDLILDLLLHSFRSWNELFRDRKGNLNQEKEVRVRSPGRTFLVHKSTRWTKNCRRSSTRPS